MPTYRATYRCSNPACIQHYKRTDKPMKVCPKCGEKMEKIKLGINAKT